MLASNLNTFATTSRSRPILCSGEALNLPSGCLAGITADVTVLWDETQALSEGIISGKSTKYNTMTDAIISTQHQPSTTEERMHIVNILLSSALHKIIAVYHQLTQAIDF